MLPRKRSALALLAVPALDDLAAGRLDLIPDPSVFLHHVVIDCLSLAVDHLHGSTPSALSVTQTEKASTVGCV